MKAPVLVLACAVAFAACVPMAPPREPLPLDYFEEGKAAVYGSAGSDEGNGSGTVGAPREWDPGMITAAHRSLPVGTCVLVTNLENGFDARVHITDRGAYTPGVILQVSRTAARKLGMLDARNGIARVRLTPCE